MFFSLSEAGAGWSADEKALIDGEGVMRVLTIDDTADSLFLRTPTKELSPKQIRSAQYKSLAERMIATVTSPEQDGVGIAGPQVGIGRRIVAVQRFDKPGEPFEVYPNIRITARRGEPEPGPEGCLSVPNRRGEVLRWQDIDISYVSPATGKDTSETVQGFTAVIFQHETDHLDGVLYIDKLVP
jgi:peptide deformylase